MNENYIVINGKKIDLTAEQLKALGIEVKAKRNNPFERVEVKKTYYTAGDVEYEKDIDLYSYVDDLYYEYANYFNDKVFAEHVALHQLLYRKLLKFAYDNECEDTAEWDGINPHWAIRYDGNLNKFFAYSQERYKARDIYFSSYEATERAIKEVVEPFVKEHPEFTW